MGFEADFAKSNKKLSPGSVRVYINNIKRLALLSKQESVPTNGKWLFAPKLLAAVKKMPPSKQKLLSTAAVVAARHYKVAPKAWTGLMESSTDAVAKGRQKQRKTKREKILMPKGGYAEVKRAAAKLRAQLPKDTKNLKDLMRVQDAWLLSFFSMHAPRLINDVVVGSGTNTITKKGKQYTITLRKHKTSKSMGDSVINLDKSLSELTGRLIEAGTRLTKSKRLLSAPRGGALSKANLSRRLTKITSKTLGRGFSTQIIRVLKATSQDPEMKKVREILSEMGHSLKQQQKYVAK